MTLAGGARAERDVPRTTLLRARAGAAVLAPVVLTCGLVASHTEGARQALTRSVAVLGMSACGPFLLPVLQMPHEALRWMWRGAPWLWLLYLLGIGFTRIGLVRWGYHLVLATSWTLAALASVMLAAESSGI